MNLCIHYCRGRGMPPRGAARGGPPRGGAVRGAPAGRGGPPTQSPRGAAATRARPPASAAQRMPPPPPPHPPAQETYEEYVRFVIRLNWSCIVKVLMSWGLFSTVFSHMMRTTKRQRMNLMRATTLNRRRKLNLHKILRLFSRPSFLKKIDFAYDCYGFGNHPSFSWNVLGLDLFFGSSSDFSCLRVVGLCSSVLAQSSEFSIAYCFSENQNTTTMGTESHRRDTKATVRLLYLAVLKGYLWYY